MSKLEGLATLLQFLGRRKKFWLGPLVVLLVLLGVVLAIAEGTALAPFIYTMF
jgi:hypothetical protein